MYAIDVSYQNFLTGERKNYRAKKQYKTWLRADRAANRACRWVVRPDGKTATARCDAVVIAMHQEKGPEAIRPFIKHN